MKKLHLISAQPDDLYFSWQIQVQLNNFRKYGVSNLARVLVYLPEDRLSIGFNPIWKDLEKQFPETKFFYYADQDHIFKIIRIFDYIPLLRPYILKRHFKEFPELKNDAIFYHDSDIVFTQQPTFLEQFSQDSTCYLSDTKSYINSDYFDSKIKDVLPNKLEDYKDIDVLKILSFTCGITRQICEENKNSSGGAQYLLKNIDAQFWDDVFNASCDIRLQLRNINKRYFENEDKGFQSWCADMWAVLWNLWKRNYKTVTPPEMDFAWAGDKLDKWKSCQIYHDAQAPVGAFNKRHQGFVDNEITPFEIDLPEDLKDICSYNYVQEIKETQENLNL